MDHPRRAVRTSGWSWSAGVIRSLLKKRRRHYSLLYWLVLRGRVRAIRTSWAETRYVIPKSRACASILGSGGRDDLLGLID